MKNKRDIRDGRYLAEPDPVLIKEGEAGTRMPKGFSAKEREVWRRVVGHMLHAGIWRRCDRDEVEVYCRTIGRIHETQKIIDKEGEFITDEDTGISTYHPMVKELRYQMQTARTAAQALGIGPVARDRLSIQERGAPVKLNGGKNTKYNPQPTNNSSEPDSWTSVTTLQ